MNRVLVVAAHPDDEVLGCGGTIVRHRDSGDEVHVLIMSRGIASRGAEQTTEQQQSLERLFEDARNANRVLDVTSLSLLDFPDNRMDKMALLDIVKSIEEVVARVRPTIVYTHSAGDVNIDHRRTHDAVIAACRPLPGTELRRLLFFEILSSTEWRPPASHPTFGPNVFCEIGSALERKLEALRVYRSEMREFPHPRSLEAVEHLACFRGATIGVSAAEAFMLGWERT